MQSGCGKVSPNAEPARLLRRYFLDHRPSTALFTIALIYPSIPTVARISQRLFTTQIEPLI
jgi:hypothetical protein